MLFFFFFSSRRRHTRCSRDWSSDVCSSDLRTSHTAVMVRRRQWFERPTEAYQALWWVPAGHSPSVSEALDRLEHLRRNGPTAHAFTFSQRYPPPGELGELGQARGYEPREVLRRRELRAAPT